MYVFYQYESYILPVTILTIFIIFIIFTIFTIFTIFNWVDVLGAEYQLVNIRMKLTKKEFLYPRVQ